LISHGDGRGGPGNLRKTQGRAPWTWRVTAIGNTMRRLEAWRLAGTALAKAPANSFDAAVKELEARIDEATSTAFERTKITSPAILRTDAQCRQRI